MWSSIGGGACRRACQRVCLRVGKRFATSTKTFASMTYSNFRTPIEIFYRYSKQSTTFGTEKRWTESVLYYEIHTPSSLCTTYKVLTEQKPKQCRFFQKPSIYLEITQYECTVHLRASWAITCTTRFNIYLFDTKIGSLLTRLPHLKCIRLGSVRSSHLPFKVH